MSYNQSLPKFEPTPNAAKSIKTSNDNNHKKTNTSTVKPRAAIQRNKKKKKQKKKHTKSVHYQSSSFAQSHLANNASTDSEGTVMQQLAIETITEIHYWSRELLITKESIQNIQNVSLKILADILNDSKSDGGYIFWHLKLYVKQAEQKVGDCFRNKRNRFHSLILSTYKNKLQCYYQKKVHKNDK